MKTKKFSDIAEIRLQLQGIIRSARGLRAVATEKKNQHALSTIIGTTRALLARVTP